MKLTDILFATTGGALLLALAVVMVRRRLWRAYPFFFGYILFNLSSTVFLFAVSHDYKVFFYSYWIGEGISAIFVVLALHEAFYDVFRAFYLVPLFRLIFPSVVALISFFHIRHAVLYPRPRVPLIMTVVFATDYAIAYVKAGVFVVFMFLVILLHVRWRRYPYDVALGFAVSSVGMLISYSVFQGFGTGHIVIARYAPPVAYIVATSIWIWSFAAKLEPEPRPEWKHDLTPEQLLQEMKDYIVILRKVAGTKQ
jgi:hypothetical protein